MTSITLANPDVFANGAPWSLFEELRKNHPVHWSEEEKPNSGFFSVTRFHDIVKVLRDPDTFTSERFTNLEEVDAEQEEAQEEIETEYSGDAVEIGFNVSYLLDVLANLKNEKIQISLGDANSSAVITLPGSEDFKYVVMPMRI